MTSSFEDIDAVVEAAMLEWKVPGLALTIVRNDQVELTRVFGFRDFEYKLPFTEHTLFPIASNGKLFIAVAAGLLVDDGLLTYDDPICERVPSLKFPTKELDQSITLRDMLSHRTGLGTKDMIWYKSEFSPKELFERVRFLKVESPLRSDFIYNNLIYDAIGHIISVISGRPWTEFVDDRILRPLGMKDSLFDVRDMLKREDFAVPAYEDRTSGLICRMQHYVDKGGPAASGAVISNLIDIGKWLLALHNSGRVNGTQVLSKSALDATLQAAFAFPEDPPDDRKYWELMAPAYGLGRGLMCLRGHWLADHSGYLNGFASYVGSLPKEKAGVAVFMIGDSPGLCTAIGRTIVEKIVGLSSTPWIRRARDVNNKRQEALAKHLSAVEKPPLERYGPAHRLDAYLGKYTHEVYGALVIDKIEHGLVMVFREMVIPLTHFNFERFDFFQDVPELWGGAVSFVTNLDGIVNEVAVPLDLERVLFIKQA